MGDYNLNLESYNVNDSVNVFVNIMLSSGLLPTITKPTRITDVSATLIDNIFTNAVNSNCKSGIIYADISDHLPVILQTPATDNNLNKTQIKTVKRRQYTDQSISNFRSYLININWLRDYPKIYSADPNLAYEEFSKAFNYGFNLCFLLKAPFCYRNAPRKCWMTTGLAKSCEEKSRLYKQYISKKNSRF